MRLGVVEFEEFVQARGAALLRYGYVLTGNPDDAADLVQEALLKLGDTWRKVRNKDNPESYVRTIMTRQHVKRVVLVLRYYEDLSDQEIADILGISRGTVRSQASRALHTLRIRPALLERERA
ncbi:SigE family RNA polymerase sigma factor [Nonomuraea spiralis]|uniref:SigE family RNA polymerase sigma factor n=1 Tax=Nonomuraea TaxID=83681 RepID=UPI0021AE1062|nr:SigE family RNA polymerase sigma factor [Nonomuraea sp. WAC 01424]